VGKYIQNCNWEREREKKMHQTKPLTKPKNTSTDEKSEDFRVFQHHPPFYLNSYSWGRGVQLGPLGTAATNTPIVPAPSDYDDGEFSGMMIDRGNRSTVREKPAQMLFCLPQTSHAARTRTRAATLGSQRLTAWATARRTHLPLTPFEDWGREREKTKYKNAAIPKVIYHRQEQNGLFWNCITW
jgi:hypothetical protein